MVEFPPFFRFNNVDLRYYFGSQSIQEKWQLFGRCLQSLYVALCDSNEIYFGERINQNDPSQFCDSTTLLNYLKEGFLPIFDSPRRYEFQIVFDSDKNASTNVIASILTIPQIVRSSNVWIGLHPIYMIMLPVEAIDQWLNKKSEEIGFFGQMKREKVLNFHSRRVQNAVEMCGHLKEVLAYL